MNDDLRDRLDAVAEIGGVDAHPHNGVERTTGSKQIDDHESDGLGLGAAPVFVLPADIWGSR